MASAEPEQRGRPEQLAGCIAQARGDLGERLHRVVAVRAGHEDPHEVTRGRVAELSPALQLSREEGVDIVARRKRDRPRLGLERLHEHSARRVPAAPARELGHQLEGALLGAEVGHAEAQVSVDDGRERDVR